MRPQSTFKRSRSTVIGLGLFILILFSSIYHVSGTISQDELSQLYSDNLLQIYGEGVSSPVNISLTALRNGTYTTYYDVEYFFLNRVGTNYTSTISGVSLGDILNSSVSLLDNASYIRFVGSDGAKSFYLPLRIINAHPEMVLLMIEENGETPEDGPLKAAVLMDAIENDGEMIEYFLENCAPGENFVHNSKYAWKWLTAIEISTKESITTETGTINPDDDKTDDASDDMSDDSPSKLSIPNASLLHFGFLFLIGTLAIVSYTLKKRTNP